MKSKPCPWCIPGIDNCHCLFEEIEKYYAQESTMKPQPPNQLHSEAPFREQRIWHKRTAVAVAKAKNAPLTADLVDAMAMQELEYEFLKLEESLMPDKTISFNNEELKALSELARQRDLTIRQVVRQAIRRYQMQIIGLRDLDALRRWKEEALAVESEWDPDMLAKELGVTLGKSLRKGIQEAALSMKGAINDAMAYLDKRGVLRGNGEDEFTLTGRIQGIFESGEGLQGQYRLQHESITAFRELWKSLPNRILPNDDYQSDKLLVAELQQLIRNIAVFSDHGPEGRNVQNGDYVKVLRENDKLKEGIKEAEEKASEALRAIEHLTKVRAVSSNWSDASKEIHDRLSESLGQDFEHIEVPVTNLLTENKEIVFPKEHCLVCGGDEPCSHKFDETESRSIADVLEADVLELRQARSLRFRIQCRHELSEEEDEDWFITDRNDFDNPEISFRIHPEDLMFFKPPHREAVTTTEPEIHVGGRKVQFQEGHDSYLKDWEKWVAETATYFDCGGGDITYPLLGLVGELGELVNSIVKYYRKADLITLKIQDLPQDLRQKLKDESYDALHFLMFLLNEQGLSLEGIIDYGRKKLEKRMEEGTIHKANRISGSIVGKKILISGKNGPEIEAVVSKETLHSITIKRKSIRRIPMGAKIEIVGDATPAEKTNFRYVFDIQRDKFYNAL